MLSCASTWVYAKIRDELNMVLELHTALTSENITCSRFLINSYLLKCSFIPSQSVCTILDDVFYVFWNCYSTVLLQQCGTGLSFIAHTEPLGGASSLLSVSKLVRVKLSHEHLHFLHLYLWVAPTSKGSIDSISLLATIIYLSSFSIFKNGADTYLPHKGVVRINMNPYSTLLIKNATVHSFWPQKQRYLSFILVCWVFEGCDGVSGSDGRLLCVSLFLLRIICNISSPNSIASDGVERTHHIVLSTHQEAVQEF